MTLRERVAKAIDEANSEISNSWEDVADAAIAIVREEAAKVIEIYEMPHEAEFFAAVIRKLK